MKLHWSPRSPFVRYVMVVAHEKNIVSKLDLVRSVVAMTTINEDLMTANPLSKIPTLILDTGVMLADSRNIARYFDLIGEGAKLFPPVGAEGASVHSHEAVALGHLDLLILWRNELARPQETQSLALLEAFRSKHDAVLNWYGNVDFDQDVNAASLATACALSYLDFRFGQLDWRGGHPRLASWHAELESCPSFIATRPGDEAPAP